MAFKISINNAIPVERFGPVPANPAARLLSDIRQPRHERVEFSRNPFFEELLGQIVREEAILVAGAPGSNKSTLARQLAIDLAAKGHRTLFILTEENPERLKSAILKQTSDWPADDVKKVLSNLHVETTLHDVLTLPNFLTQTVLTGDHPNPTAAAWRFSPVSNNRRSRVSTDDETRVLIATDVLSEGQNLQDCHVVVNYDLPWAIIRLIQRAGRVDRIGQEADRILCYSFWPADGVERIINLRNRVRRRLRENAEVVGTDESFFEDETSDQAIRDLFTEKSGILDGDDARHRLQCPRRQHSRRLCH
jgi:hypothetical protein